MRTVTEVGERHHVAHPAVAQQPPETFSEKLIIREREILVDRAENPAKCSILPLAYREDFRIVMFRRGEPLGEVRGRIEPAGS